MLGFDLRSISKLRRFQEEFTDLGQLGEGGFGGVHRVRNHLDNRQYAAKLIKIKPSNCRQDNEERLYRLLGQTKAHALLSHPNVLQYHGCWFELTPRANLPPLHLRSRSSAEEDFQMVVVEDTSQDSSGFVFGSASSDEASGHTGHLQVEKMEMRGGEIDWGTLLEDYQQVRVYLLTELCEQNLQTYLSKRNRVCKGKGLNIEQKTEAIQMALQIITGMVYLHSKRIIHRDIKLHNIMLDSHGKCKIIDFGLAKRVKHWKTSINEHLPKDSIGNEQEDEEKFSTSVGTKLFSSPQQANSDNYDYRTDIYSLGMVIALLFSVFSTAHHLRDLLDKMRKRSLEGISLDPALKSLLWRCLGTEQERPSLAQLQKCLKEQLKLLKSEKKLRSLHSGCRAKEEETQSQMVMA